MIKRKLKLKDKVQVNIGVGSHFYMLLKGKIGTVVYYKPYQNYIVSFPNFISNYIEIHESQVDFVSNTEHFIRSLK